MGANPKAAYAKDSVVDDSPLIPLSGWPGLSFQIQTIYLDRDFWHLRGRDHGMKDGRTALAYKAEHAVDMDTGAIVTVTAHGGAVGDTSSVGETLPAAGEAVAEEIPEPTADGKFKVNAKGVGIPFYMGREKATRVDAVTSNFADGVSVQIMRVGIPWARQAMRHYMPTGAPTEGKEDEAGNLAIHCPKCHSTEVILDRLVSEPTDTDGKSEAK
jgi:hypothetical protein